MGGVSPNEFKGQSAQYKQINWLSNTLLNFCCVTYPVYSNSIGVTNESELENMNYGHLVKPIDKLQLAFIFIFWLIF